MAGLPISKPEKIGTLSISTSTLSLSASRLNIGGRQYVTTAATNATLSGLVSGTVYFAYMVAVAGVPTLVYSVNADTIGPGTSAWKLCGVFVATSATSGLVLKEYPLTDQTPSAISGTVIDWSVNRIFYKTVSTTTTFTFSNVADAAIVTVSVTDSGGNTVSFSDANLVWISGVAPIQSANKTDLYNFMKVGAKIYGSVIQGYA